MWERILYRLIPRVVTGNKHESVTTVVQRANRRNLKDQRALTEETNKPSEN